MTADIDSMSRREPEPTGTPSRRHRGPAGPSRDRRGYGLLALRLFLGLVYLYAGISKIADRRFLDPSSPVSMHAAVVSARTNSPVGALLGPAVQHSTAFGVAMAVAELAVGIGMLAGMFTRVAAGGGALLALALWLTVSWHAEPWFTSADLVYLVAFTPFLLGAGTPWSVDSWLTEASLRSVRAGDDSTRREMVAGLGVLSAAVFLGGAWLVRRSGSSASVRQPPVTLVATGKVPLRGAVKVPDDRTGATLYVTQPARGRFVALNAACPHQGCIVDFVSASDGFVCPCHLSHFAYNGNRLSGPTPRGLARVSVELSGTNVVTRD